MQHMGNEDSQLLKGVLTLVLLRLLSDKESYGYELVTRIQEAGVDVAEGTVYPALSRLEREGLVTSRLVASANGPARKYYSPSRAGRERLRESFEAWSRLRTALDQIFVGGAAKGPRKEP